MKSAYKTGGKICYNWDPLGGHEEVCGGDVSLYARLETPLPRCAGQGEGADVFLTPALPGMLIKLCNFMAALSAVFNVAPSYLMDGQHITRVQMEVLTGNFTDMFRANCCDSFRDFPDFY